MKNRSMLASPPFPSQNSTHRRTSAASIFIQRGSRSLTLESTRFTVLPRKRGEVTVFENVFSRFKARPSLEQNPMFYARKSLRFALTSRIISALNPALTTMARFIASYRASIIPVIGGGGKGEGEK